MNHNFLFIYIPTLLTGILIHKLIEARISLIIQRQKGVAASKSGEDVVREIFGEDVKIKRLDQAHGLGGETYDSNQDEFSLTEDIGVKNAAAVTMGYFLAIQRLEKITGGTLHVIGKVLQGLLTFVAMIFIPILIFSESITLFYAAFGIYCALVVLFIAFSPLLFKLNRSGIRRLFMSNEVTLEGADEGFLNVYLNGLRMQAFFLAPFSPILVPYYLFELIVKRGYRLRRRVV